MSGVPLNTRVFVIVWVSNKFHHCEREAFTVSAILCTDLDDHVQNLLPKSLKVLKVLKVLKKQALPRRGS